MFARVQQNIFHKLWVGILLTGYVAILCSQVLVVSNREGKNSFFNTCLVRQILKDSGSHTAYKNIQSKKTKSLHLRINKHFETGKYFCILPQSIKFSSFRVVVFKPLYYYNNHFVSSFLYVCEGRAPPVIA
jgi:hypothetical protein